MKEMGMTQAELADKIGVTQGAISQMINGGTSRTRFLPMIAEALAVNFAWLSGSSDILINLIGRDSMSVTEQQWLEGDRFEEPGSEYRPEPRPSAEDRLLPRDKTSKREPPVDTVEIEHIDLRFGMGGTYLDNPVESNRRRFPRAWVRSITTAPPEQLLWTEGDGDSMEPTIRSGEPILIDRGQTNPMMADGIWAFAFGEIGMIKRLRPMPDGTIEIHSDNPLVRTAVATEGELRVFGRVIAKVGRL
jgi:phage repressor protein C with HTH and peptisase S24 domain